MPKIGEMKNSRFLTQHDVGEDGRIVTVESVDQQNVAPENQPKELKWVMHFAEEWAKPLVLNRVNTELAAKVLKSDDTDDWCNKQIVAYQDPTINYGGKVIGGIRLRSVKPTDKAGDAPDAEPDKPKSESKGDAINDSNFGDVKIHVGKCKGQALRDLTPEQVAGLNTHWLPAAQANSKPTADDQRLMKALAIAGSKSSDDAPY
jgi:hypothetical protein